MAEENYSVLKQYGTSFLFTMAARINRDEAIKLMTRSKGDEDVLVPMIIREERRELRDKYSR